MPTIIRQEDPAYFKIVGTVLTFSDALLAQLAALAGIARTVGRQVWTPPLLHTSTSLPSIVALIPWVQADNTTATEKALHLRAILQTADSDVDASLTVTSLNSGQNLTIQGPSNVFSSNSTTPEVVESTVDLFSTPTNVFDPTRIDILVVTLAASGDATVQCKFVELILVAP